MQLERCRATLGGETLRFRPESAYRIGAICHSRHRGVARAVAAPL